MFKFVRSRQKGKDRQRDEDESATENSSNDSSDALSSDLDSGTEEDDDLRRMGAGALAASNILAQPLVPDEEDENVTVCLICPGKVLKHSKMAKVHTSSSVSFRLFHSSRNLHWQLILSVILSIFAQNHQRRVQRFQKCTEELESETNEHPTLHAVLYRMNTTVADFVPKRKKVRYFYSNVNLIVCHRPLFAQPPKMTRNDNSESPGKPKLSGKEKKLVRKARQDAGSDTTVTIPSATTTRGGRQRTGANPKTRTTPESEGNESNAPQNQLKDNQVMRQQTHKRRSEREGVVSRKKKKVKV